MSTPPDTLEPRSPPLSVKLIIGRYHDALMSFLRHRLHRQDDAADIAQETYLRLMAYEGSTEVRSASALLFRIAANVVRDRVLRQVPSRGRMHSNRGCGDSG